MKKFIISLFSFLLYLTCSAQSYYKATVTELYDYNSNSKEWVLNTKNSDVNIIIVIEEEFLTIQAKSPSMYKVFPESGQELKTKKIVGFRYDARDLRRDISVKIDIVRSTDNSVSMISIINTTEGYNFRFFISPIEN